MLRILGRSLILIAVFTIGMAGGLILDRQVVATFVPLDNIPSNAESHFRLMAEAWNTIGRSYVDRAAVKPTTLTYGAISGMVESLGGYRTQQFSDPRDGPVARGDGKGSLQGHRR